MKKLFFMAVIPIIAMVSCTKTVESPVTATQGPTIAFKTFAILTLGDSIKNVTLIPPFTKPASNYLNYLNTTIQAWQCNIQWSMINESGQSEVVGSTAQLGSNLVFSIQEFGATSGTMLQFQNKEIDHYSDGSSKDVLVGPQYYGIVNVQ